MVFKTCGFTMTIIRYPIPYELDAVYGRGSKPRNIVIADDIPVEIRDIASTEAPVVMRADMTWKTGGLPGQGREEWQLIDGDVNNHINPTTEVRAFDESLWVPIRKFSRTEDVPSTTARPIDLESPVNHQTALATPFHRLFADLPRHRQLNLEAQALGRLPRFDQAKIKSVYEGGGQRDALIEDVREFLADMLCIDGELWQKLSGEPRIHFERKPRIVDDGKGDRVENVVVFSIATSPSVANPFNSGDFNLNRIDDCLEHVCSHFANMPHIFLFENLDIRVAEAFNLDEEHDELLKAAHKVLSELEKAAFYLTPRLIELANNLKWAISQGHEHDKIAEIMEDMLPHLKHHPDIGKGISAATDRWKLRPVELSSCRPGFGG